MSKRSPCMRSLGGVGSSEDFCNNTAHFQVVVVFNGHRYLVDLCEQHKAEHDDEAARRRQARKAANTKSKTSFEARRQTEVFDIVPGIT